MCSDNHLNSSKSSIWPPNHYTRKYSVVVHQVFIFRGKKSEQSEGRNRSNQRVEILCSNQSKGSTSIAWPHLGAPSWGSEGNGLNWWNQDMPRTEVMPMFVLLVFRKWFHFLLCQTLSYRRLVHYFAQKRNSIFLQTFLAEYRTP